ncbi:hypothetical protein ACOMHN_022934 [Nucella lapillus]
MAEEKARQLKSGTVSRNNSFRQIYEQDATAPNYPQTTSRQNGVKDGAVKNASRQTYDAQNEAIPSATAPENYVWSDRVQSLRDFVSKHKLPAIARVLSSAGELPQELLSPSRSHQQQSSAPPGSSAVYSQSQGSVVRIHEVGKRRVVLARHVQWEKRQNDYVASGKQVDIHVPAPFKGWFEAAPEDGRALQNCDTVGAMCGDKPRQFLVRTPTVAYRLSGEEGAPSCWMPHEISSGEVLSTGVVYDHMPNVRSSNSRTSRAADGGKRGKRSRSVSPGRGFLRRLMKPSRNKHKSEHEYKYLQCFDANGQEFTIPLATTGICSPVGDPTLASYDAVYQLHDLILAFGLPVNVQLIHRSPGEKNACPAGVLKLYGTREEEMALLSRVELGKDDLVSSDISQLQKAEVSLDRNLQLQQGRPVSEKEKQPAVCASNTTSKTDEAPASGVGDKREEPYQIELPKSVTKELKKFKSTGILDKLSVRAMRKERSKVKEKTSSNAKQVAHHDLCYKDFFNGLDKPQTQKERYVQSDKLFDGKSNQNSEKSHNNQQESPHEFFGSNDTSSSTNGQRRLSLQQIRDLPPLPRRTPVLSSSHQVESSKGSKDSLYDHLPPAPTPPHQRSRSDPDQSDHNGGYHRLDNNNNDNDDDDGYMVPSDIPGTDTASSPAKTNLQVQYRSPQVPHRSGKTSRLKKCHSELFPAHLLSGGIAAAADDDCHLDIDRLFSSTYSKKFQSLYGPVAATPWTGSTSQIYDFNAQKAQASDAVTAWRADVERHQDRQALRNLGVGSLGRRSAEKLNLDTPSSAGRHGKRPSSHRINTNATLRAHNLRQPKASLLELFQFGDSFQDEADQNPSSSPTTSLPVSSSSVQSAVNQSHFPSMSVARIGGDRRRDSSYGEMVTSPSTALPGNKGAPEYRYNRHQQCSTYAESKPLFNTIYTPSLSAFSDPAYPKHGDDSAISVGSRDRENPYGFTNGSNLSFHYDNGSGGTLTSVEEYWTPPEDISELSVLEVSCSLHYIGMKDRVVLRFANEQIDGKLLSSLDKRLLKEGFPELNALEIKKILDFVHGWRPKKR